MVGGTDHERKQREQARRQQDELAATAGPAATPSAAPVAPAGGLSEAQFVGS